MGQTITTASFEVQPDSAKLLEQLIVEFRTSREQASTEPYADLRQAVPTLHFMSIMLFRRQNFDPLPVIEVNFDGTWDSYLDDFIEKANSGTTLAWTNCVGSPSAKFLVLDGVRKGRQFKAWARHSMTLNLFWFSAYPKLTVNQIERNHVIAEGLRKPALQAGKAAQWISKL